MDPRVEIDLIKLKATLRKEGYKMHAQRVYERSRWDYWPGVAVIVIWAGVLGSLLWYVFS